MPSLDPIEGGGEPDGGLFVAGRQGPPLFESAPEVLDQSAIGVGPVRTGDR